jgi:dipeptidyl aminopeptidase/acylaminoacyl peptidase
MRYLLTAFSILTLAVPSKAATLHEYSGLAISPSGDRLASVESDEQANASTRGHGHIAIRSAKDGAVLGTIDPCPACRYSGLTFAPDGRLAFLEAQGGTTRLMLAGAGAPATLATIDGIAQAPSFSPDGSQIALLATFNARKQAGATQAGVRQVGEIGEQNDEQRIALVPIGGGAARPVSPPDRYVYEYDWTPDGRGFVMTSAPGNGDDNWWVATLDRLEIASGAVTRIAAPKMQLDFPRVSPDGKTVAFIGGLMSDFGSVGGDIYTVPITGGTPSRIDPYFKGTFTSLLWDKNGLAASSLVGDRMAIVETEPRGASGNALWDRQVSISAGDARFARSADGRTYATVVQDFEHPPAIYAGPGADPIMRKDRQGLRQITHDNDSLTPLVHAQSVNWKNDGFDVQGWLLAPIDATRNAKAPMIVEVHGGPAAANSPSFLWEGARADLARAGYYEFLPNPRGSYGQGEAFTRANIRDFGGGDLRDILAGVDAAEKIAPIDDSRLGLIGHSYGGFMAMWANTQTNRFKAIVGGAGLSDWISYYGTNGIDQWMIPFFGASLYDDPAPYWKMSAIRTIRNAHTPTFLYVGERDIEVPPTQSVEYWHALKAENVPVSLVIYPDEGHGIRAPEHTLDIRKRTVGWFDRYLGPPAKP